MNIYCFAGPNGSGKSTTVNNFINENQLIFEDSASYLFFSY